MHFHIPLFFVAGAACLLPHNVFAETQASRTVVELSNLHPLEQIPVNDEVSAKPFNLLVLAITKVINPKLRPVTIEVNFKSAKQIWRVGTVTLYPADHPETFKLRINQTTQASIRQGTTGKEHDIVLCIEIQPEKTESTVDNAAFFVRLSVQLFAGIDS